MAGGTHSERHPDTWTPRSTDDSQGPHPPLRCTSGNMALNRCWQNCLLLFWGSVLSFFSFFAEPVVLNLNKLNMPFSQQINSLLKILSAKNSLPLCNKLSKCFDNSKNTPALKSTSSFASLYWQRVPRAPLNSPALSR